MPTAAVAQQQEGRRRQGSFDSHSGLGTPPLMSSTGTHLFPVAATGVQTSQQQPQLAGQPRGRSAGQAGSSAPPPAHRTASFTEHSSKQRSVSAQAVPGKTVSGGRSDTEKVEDAGTGGLPTEPRRPAAKHDRRGQGPTRESGMSATAEALAGRFVGDRITSTMPPAVRYTTSPAAQQQATSPAPAMPPAPARPHPEVSHATLGAMAAAGGVLLGTTANLGTRALESKSRSTPPPHNAVDPSATDRSMVGPTSSTARSRGSRSSTARFQAELDRREQEHEKQMGALGGRIEQLEAMLLAAAQGAPVPAMPSMWGGSQYGGMTPGLNPLGHVPGMTERLFAEATARAETAGRMAMMLQNPMPNVREQDQVAHLEALLRAARQQQQQVEASHAWGGGGTYDAGFAAERAGLSDLHAPRAMVRDESPARRPRREEETAPASNPPLTTTTSGTQVPTPPPGNTGQPQPLLPNPPAGAVQDGGPPWERFIDPTSGRVWFWNSRTGESLFASSRSGGGTSRRRTDDRQSKASSEDRQAAAVAKACGSTPAPAPAAPPPAALPKFGAPTPPSAQGSGKAGCKAVVQMHLPAPPPPPPSSSAGDGDAERRSSSAPPAVLAMAAAKRSLPALGSPPAQGTATAAATAVASTSTSTSTAEATPVVTDPTPKAMPSQNRGRATRESSRGPGPERDERNAVAA